MSSAQPATCTFRPASMSRDSHVAATTARVGADEC